MTMHNRYPGPPAPGDASGRGRPHVKLHPGRGDLLLHALGPHRAPRRGSVRERHLPRRRAGRVRPRGGPRSDHPRHAQPRRGRAWGFTTDIAGYARTSSAPPPRKPLRALERGGGAHALLPRPHRPLDGPRMPWSYDAATEATWTAMATPHRHGRRRSSSRPGTRAVQIEDAVVAAPAGRRPGLGGDAAQRRRVAGRRRSARRAGGRAGRDLARGEGSRPAAGRRRRGPLLAGGAWPSR